MRTLRVAAGYVLPPLLAFALLVAFWEAYVAWKDVSVVVVPAPHRIAQRLWDDPWFFCKEGAYTLYEATAGLLIGTSVALALALVMSYSRLLERAIFPIAIAVKVTPIVAISPVLVVIFGFGVTPKLIVATLLCFFPMLVNATIGFRDVNSAQLEFFRSLSASRWQVFWKLRAPSSLPYIVSALKITYPLALTGAVVAEWFSGTHGLGYVVYSAWLNLRTPELFAAIGVLAVTGVALYATLSLIEQRVLFWHESVRSMQ
ncbi:MAG TPA: ABC transporter permease [Dehalococcoidia bacterium]|jgi:NitT/TauT family transport system permease protein|nr:ABC transporter permease [Dehalococcoidia bacterium]